jgi:hypothetical protein
MQMKTGRILFLSLPLAFTLACSDDANLGSDKDKTPVETGDKDAGEETSSPPTSVEPGSEELTTSSDEPTPSGDESSVDVPEPTSVEGTTGEEQSTEPAPTEATEAEPTTTEPVEETSSTQEPDPTSSDAGTEDSNPVPTDECEQIQCFRAVECVETCGGAVVSSGCCPCAEGTFDNIECSANPEPDAGSELDGGASYTLDDLHSMCEDDTCPSGLTPTHYFGIAGPNGPQFCSCEIGCAEDAAVCPEGTSCQTISDGPGMVCVAEAR